MTPARRDSGEQVSAVLGVGSNLADRQANIARALDLLRAERGIEVLAVSRLIETDPAGGPPQGRYLNGAIEVRTRLEPRELLAALQRIESALGRVRAVRWGPRELDLDILLYGDRVVREPDLEVPHPRMLERAFVLEPLAEIAPARVHPVTGRTILEHWRSLRSGARLPEGAA